MIKHVSRFEFLELWVKMWSLLFSVRRSGGWWRTLVISASAEGMNFTFTTFPPDWLKWGPTRQYCSSKILQTAMTLSFPPSFHFVEVVSFLIQSAAFGLMGLAPFVWWPITTNQHKFTTMKKWHHLWYIPASKLSPTIETSFNLKSWSNLPWDSMNDVY